ncbi:outer membrane protein assembly factor BamB family protein [Salinigranum halophilum]|uniref:outer membrane protein assembly factor BamB family protein n=1 Tax=Salinigranum halophilum TaxID=2565931 RepID=UPI001376365C|nr:PQQ-binding-like beta-propeller repeat protein [Salinigranum halophilum]
MERLLQLHVLTPEDDEYRWDRICEILTAEGFPIVDDGDLLFSDSEVEFATTLFEARADNLEQVGRVRSELAELYDDGDVFRHERPLNMEHGRSVKNPSAHIILQVVNIGIDQPRISWRQSFDLLDNMPRTDEGYLYHATSRSVFAVDVASGDLIWERECERITSVPEVANGIVVVKGSFSVRAYEAVSGELLWDFTTGEDPDKDLIDARVEIGPESVYIGTRGGSVLALSRTDGSCTVHSRFESAVVQVAYTDHGLLVGTADGSVYAVEPAGTPRWAQDRSFGFGPVREDVMYVTAGHRVEAISLSDGSREWQTEFTVTKEVRKQGTETDETTRKQYKAPVNGPICVTVGRLLVPTLNGVFCLTRDTGAIEWRFDPTENKPLHRFRSAHLIGERTTVALDSDGTIYCVDIETGEQFATYILGGEPHPIVPLGESAIATVSDELLRLDDFPTVQ